VTKFIKKHLHCAPILLIDVEIGRVVTHCGGQAFGPQCVIALGSPIYGCHPPHVSDIQGAYKDYPHRGQPGMTSVLIPHCLLFDYRAGILRGMTGTMPKIL
jgi:hypothetical protein